LVSSRLLLTYFSFTTGLPFLYLRLTISLPPPYHFLTTGLPFLYHFLTREVKKRYKKGKLGLREALIRDTAAQINAAPLAIGQSRVTH